MIDCQGPMTLDIYRALMETMKGLLKTNELFEEVYDYCIRVEFQGRGTLHIHVIAWAILQPGVEIAGNVVKKNGRLLCDYYISYLNPTLTLP